MRLRLGLRRRAGCAQPWPEPTRQGRRARPQSQFAGAAAELGMGVLLGDATKGVHGKRVEGAVESTDRRVGGASHRFGRYRELRQ